MIVPTDSESQRLVLKQLCFCEKCKRPIQDVEFEVTYFDDNIRIAARCHGELDKKTYERSTWPFIHNGYKNQEQIIADLKIMRRDGFFNFFIDQSIKKCDNELGNILDNMDVF